MSATVVAERHQQHQQHHQQHHQQLLPPPPPRFPSTGSPRSRFEAIPYLGSPHTSPRKSNTTPHPYRRPRDSVRLDAMDSLGTNLGGLSQSIGSGHPDRQPRLSASTTALGMFGGEPSKQRSAMFVHPVHSLVRGLPPRPQPSTRPAAAPTAAADARWGVLTAAHAGASGLTGRRFR